MIKARRLLAFAMAAVVAMGAVSCDKDESSASSNSNNGASGNGEITAGDWVDLGLPSGLLWASRNIGANQPTDDGQFFAWGETQPKMEYSWETYAYGHSYSELTKYCNNEVFGYNGYTDDLTTLQPGDDAATANWGNGARMPTMEEIKELCDNCTSEWVTLNGAKGRKFTGTNGNSIFIPAAGYIDEDGSSAFSLENYGYYWSSSLRTDGFCNTAWELEFNPGTARPSSSSGHHRYYGYTVRAVRSAK